MSPPLMIASPTIALLICGAETSELAITIATEAYCLVAWRLCRLTWLGSRSRAAAQAAGPTFACASACSFAFVAAEAEADGLTEAVADGVAEAVGDGLADFDGLGDALGLAEPLADALALALGLAL